MSTIKVSKEDVLGLSDIREGNIYEQEGKLIKRVSGDIFYSSNQGSNWVQLFIKNPIPLDSLKRQISDYIEQQNSMGVFKPATEIELISFIKSKIYEEGH